ncbi:MAG: hypothetical protein V2I63_03735 [Pseudomonadales bacterium]|jgi:hypothetical protein|nr:hypothetical protein [Pseudomonadales bacterium]
MAIAIESASIELAYSRRSVETTPAASPPVPEAPAAPAPSDGAGSGPSFSFAALERLGAAVRDVFQRFEAPLALTFDGDDGDEGPDLQNGGGRFSFSASSLSLQGDGFSFSAQRFSFSFGAASLTRPVIESEAAAPTSAAALPPAAEEPAEPPSEAVDVPQLEPLPAPTTPALNKLALDQKSVAFSLRAGSAPVAEAGPSETPAATSAASEAASSGSPAESPSGSPAAPVAAPVAPPVVTASPSVVAAPKASSPAASSESSVAAAPERSSTRATFESVQSRARVRTATPKARNENSEPAIERSPARFSGALKARTSETRFTLDLLTADGDRVRIDFSSLDTFMRLRARGVSEEGALSALDLRQSGSVREIGFDVDGELDADELEQIRELVKDVLKAGKRALRDGGEAFARLAEQGVDASDIAGFALDYSRTETKLLAKYRAVAEGEASAGSGPGTLPPEAAGALGQLADEARALTARAGTLLDGESATVLVEQVLGAAVAPVPVAEPAAEAAPAPEAVAVPARAPAEVEAG